MESVHKGVVKRMAESGFLKAPDTASKDLSETSQDDLDRIDNLVSDRDTLDTALHEPV
jgi:hypothetical protein